MVTPSQLETLLNGLLENEEKLTYSFHIEEQVREGMVNDMVC
jgi:ribosome assembly protein 4